MFTEAVQSYTLFYCGATAVRDSLNMHIADAHPHYIGIVGAHIHASAACLIQTFSLLSQWLRVMSIALH